MTVPIATSPGRSGFGPQLALSYDSGSGNGPWGFGWDLNLPAIGRKTDKGLPQYRDAEDSDVFVLAGAEDLVPMGPPDSNGNVIAQETLQGDYCVRQYRPRVDEQFARIERWRHRKTGEIHWRTISKDNVTTWFGRDHSSRVADPADATRVFRWLISQSNDDKGNTIVYEYVSEDERNIDLLQASECHRVRSANRYLKRIRYGNRVSHLLQPDVTQAAWMFEIVFDYDEGHLTPLADDRVRAICSATSAWTSRRDPFSSYRGGFEVRTHRLCRRVLVFHHFPEELRTPDYLVRSTEFTYDQTPIASFVTAVTQSGYVAADPAKPDDTYIKRSLPPLEFTYSHVPDAEQLRQEPIRNVDAQSLANLPAGLDDTCCQWVDLDGEGLSGILTEQGGEWFYKRNLSAANLVGDRDTQHAEARFASPELVGAKPSLALSGRGRFMDVTGNGRTQVVALERPMSGYYERTDRAGWEPFRPFRLFPTVDIRDPNLRFIDLNGDGHADILITEDRVLRWYPSLAADGFGPAHCVEKPLDEERGPALVFADASQSVFLADMSGDGLTDIVRIRNGEVCYWPNLGYGHFGAKVTMDGAPWFDTPEQFDPRRIRLADTDGSGTTDILYLHRDCVHLYFNQSGNRWSKAVAISQFPVTDRLCFVEVLDLLGSGTACLVWSSSLPADAGRHIRYIDLMAGRKPHLLIQSVNNLGAETRVSYAPSTRFYLLDRDAGRPWITRLPFPVHVVERVETLDRISRNRFVTRYAYHHGYYDGVEREFRGFGCVEQWDTEDFATLSGGDGMPDATNLDAASHVPPVRTVVWFHTGAFLADGRISRQFEKEYYHEAPQTGSGLTDAQFQAMRLPDTPLPATLRLSDGTRQAWTLSGDETREACRALKGSVLRREVYALDGTEAQNRPYRVTEQNHTVELLQPGHAGRHAVFSTHARETVDFSYERKLYETVDGRVADPRVMHDLTLEVDSYGNVLKSAAVSYGRRFDDLDPSLTGDDRAEQKRIHITYTENGYTNAILQADAYRTPLIAQMRTFELFNVRPDRNEPATTNPLRFDEIADKLAAASDGRHEIPFEDTHGAGITDNKPWRRCIACERTLYRPDDLGQSANDTNALLPCGILEPLALPGESFRLAFTPRLLAGVFKRGSTSTTQEDLLAPDPVSMLGGQGSGGGYVDLDGDGNWWSPFGRAFYSRNAADSPAAELASAEEGFFQPLRYRDPFHTKQFRTETVITYDPHRLLLETSTDPLGNQTRVGNDYRVLAPGVMTDANGNRSAVAFDALGLVVGTAVMGKDPSTSGQSPEGDLLDSAFVTDLSSRQIADFMANPLAQAPGLLADATTRIVYDLDAFRKSVAAYPNEPDRWQPPFSATVARETHVSDLGAAETAKIQVQFSYSDGFGREIQRKMQAEPGPLDIGVACAPNVGPRWVGSGWTIFNNKGKAVRQYEPFFDTSHAFKFGKRVGVSPVLFYDPLERVVAILHPEGTYEKTVFDPWRQATWDANDTVALDPRTDPDVSVYMNAYLAALGAWEPWLQQHDVDPRNPPADTHGRRPLADVAERTLAHANTPAVALFDSMGRTFLTIRDNAQGQRFRERMVLDIQNREREIIDALGRVVMRDDYDMVGSHLHQASMDGGERWTLNDATGKPLHAWDSRGHHFRTEYDALRRPIRSWLLEGAGPEVMIGKTAYGESQPEAQRGNLRGRVYQVFDQAGVVTTASYDFKGNPLQTTRQLAVEFKAMLDWSTPVPLESEAYATSTAYDALNRTVSMTTPDKSVVRPSYNQANLLERIDAHLRGASQATAFVTNIDYDAKGQRTLIEYGIPDGGEDSRVKTEYHYDPLTFRLTYLKTTRDGNEQLQSLSYVYDPTGNITYLRDDAQQEIYFQNRRVDPSGDYVYDALYRLIEARGREHLGQSGGNPKPPTPFDAFNAFQMNQPHPGDSNALGTYLEQYVYDAVGNMLRLQHQGSDPANAGWTRAYAYNEASLLEPANKSNRLSQTTIGQAVEAYTYDAHGNMTSMPHLSAKAWNALDQLQMTQRQLQCDVEQTYYVYDAAGWRVRKVTVKAGGEKRSERIYLGGFEIHREYSGLVRETLHIMDGERRVALVETRTDTAAPQPLIRYQLDNHLGSACLELDDQARIISYEEYTPFGSTSYQAVNPQIQAAAKRYRFTGKERDEESGLYYHGARYYAPWLARWTAVDPERSELPGSVYAYVENRPLVFMDPDGRMPPKKLPKGQQRITRYFQRPPQGQQAAAPAAAGPAAQETAVTPPPAKRMAMTDTQSPSAGPAPQSVTTRPAASQGQGVAVVGPPPQRPAVTVVYPPPQRPAVAATEQAVAMQQIPYGTGLSEKALEYRVAHSDVLCDRNVAVIEYKKGQVVEYGVAPNVPRETHAERVVVGEMLRSAGQTAEAIAVYSELQPCVLTYEGTECARFLAETLPKTVNVTYSFEYGAAKASRERGKALHDSEVERAVGERRRR